MSMIVFAGCSETLPEAVNTANEFLQYKRLHGRIAGEDEVLGIAVIGELHKSVPEWKSFDMESGSGVLSDNRNLGDSLSRESAAGAMGIRAAFACRNAWSLCTFDGPGLRGAPDADVRRERIVALLKGVLGDSGWTFLPVYSGEKLADLPQEADMHAPTNISGPSQPLYVPERGIQWSGQYTSTNRIPA